jgi:molecular chaperone GrpE (heat shock protein)
MVRRQFLAKLEGLGVTPIDAADRQPSIRHIHEAITSCPPPPDQDGRRRHRPQGYRIGDDVLRPASVAVAKR